jgi:Coenzyme F420-dependent N5,N10-methylene tetrahydromethanopterin reductase and related flavin-dependent oxidoreductases
MSAPGGERASLRYGIVLDWVYDASVSPVQQMAEHERLVRMADELGFDVVFSGQHFLPVGLRFYQPVPYLARLSAIAPRMRVGTGIMLLPLLHPIDAAEQIATLDVVTQGKVVFGVGLGYTSAEFEAFGIPRRERAGRMEESISVIRKLWRGEPFSHRGRYFSFEAPEVTVRPLQQPHPPIWVAGQSVPAVRRAARLGDTWYPPPMLSHRELRDLHDLHLAERERLGRGAPEAVPVRRDLYLASSARAAEDAIGPYALGRTRTYLAWGMAEDEASRASLSLDERAGLGERFLLGEPQAVADQLLDLRERMGMTHFVLRLQWPGMPFSETLEQLSLFGEKVMELVR